ncbi:hypothetical protein SAMN05428945_6612 [Streptomyces sp. 2224.1]|uniref:hypothetical protein n=1 Tax=Streptomyces sp. 2224.1 TaxID=1881020 RepID=UPI00089A5A85|nr:hypothetical protein [Streptomyces sp. 2224.1]SEE16492.1 hypothetical protein SAMN05428945_6612 [Streptomyces sp. 2224.1]
MVVALTTDAVASPPALISFGLDLAIEVPSVAAVTALPYSADSSEPEYSKTASNSTHQAHPRTQKPPPEHPTGATHLSPALTAFARGLKASRPPAPYGCIRTTRELRLSWRG